MPAFTPVTCTVSQKAWARCLARNRSASDSGLASGDIAAAIKREGLDLWVTVSAAVDFADGIFVSLLCGHAGPVSILRVIVLDAQSHIVEVTKLELSRGVALLRRAAIPERGLHIVARHAVSKIVKVCQPLLSI